MHGTECLVSPLDMKIDNNSYESDLADELIEMHVDPKAEALFRCMSLSEHWSNINTSSKYPDLREPAAFPTSYFY